MFPHDRSDRLAQPNWTPTILSTNQGEREGDTLDIDGEKADGGSDYHGGLRKCSEARGECFLPPDTGMSHGCVYVSNLLNLKTKYGS